MLHVSNANVIIGMSVYDSITEKEINVKVGIATMTCDLPAASKIAEHSGHSSFRPCGRCFFRGSVCGCKSESHEDAPARFNNYTTPPTRDPEIVSGTDRKKKPGEHIVFTDSDDSR